MTFAIQFIDKIPFIHNLPSIHKMQFVHKRERSFGDIWACFVEKHPVLSFISVVIGFPAGMLAAVFASTWLVMSPIGWLLGWL